MYYIYFILINYTCFVDRLQNRNSKKKYKDTRQQQGGKTTTRILVSTKGTRQQQGYKTTTTPSQGRADEDHIYFSNNFCDWIQTHGIKS